MIPFFLNPKSVLRALEDIDRTPPSHTAPRAEGSKTAMLVLFSAAISVLVLNYCKNSAVLDQFLMFIAAFTGLDAGHYLDKLNASHWSGLWRYAWWTAWHVVTYIVLPFIVIRVFLRQRFRDFGWGWGETHRHWRGYLVLLTPIVIGVLLVSFRDDFKDHYPFYHQAGRSLFDLLAWECLYLLQFACLEFFYRGYLVQSLRPYYGSGAIWIMVIPYLMIHLPKPWIEATGAIFFGLFLGLLALRSRSIWGGFLVHAGVAISMDLMSLIQQNRLPQQWWPG